ncbi:MAG: ATP-binding protein [Planctomycetia bacterium]|nr:ATP-binding protein [Planctomycetia bacterium]
MAFLSGPRQVGKTTTCRSLAGHYLNWDDPDDRRLIVEGSGAVARRLGLDRAGKGTSVVVFDELHKHRKWRDFLKGLFDIYGEAARFLVTGSSRLDVFRRAGDSLMGRYCPYRMHPLSVGELLHPTAPRDLLAPPAELPEGEFRALLDHGGFPDPLVKRDPRVTRSWRRQRRDLVLRMDSRDFTNISDIARLEVLGDILAERSATQLVFARLASDLSVAIDTARRWVDALASLHYGFLLRPWSKSIAKSLRKEPKWYLRDWSGIANPGARAETFVAAHLLKAVEGWTDLGFGDFELRYLRDKQKREVDFVVIRDGKPWMLVEAKAGDGPLSPALEYFQAATKAPHAFQVVVDAPFVVADAVERKGPVIVPARTLLSQLL